MMSFYWRWIWHMTLTAKEAHGKFSLPRYITQSVIPYKGLFCSCNTEWPFLGLSIVLTCALYILLLIKYGTCHNKVSLVRSYECLFPFLPYARARSCQTPVCVVFGHPYHLYARWQSTPVFIKRRISTRMYESFGMFAERSKCYSCLSSVCACSCCLLFRVFITACASQDGVFRLREAENPCLLSLQEELHGNRTMFGGRGILSYQSRHSEVPSSLQGHS